MKNFQFSIFNFQLKKVYFHNSGFSFIELLIVVTLVGVIGMIVTQIMVLGFRSLGKSEVMKEVKQNGDYTMSVMEMMIRNATDILGSQCNIASSQQLTITNPDGYVTTFDCSGNEMASISGLVAPTIPLTSTKVVIANCSFRVVCPTPPLSPKYVLVNFTLRYAGSSLTPTPGSYSVLNYQSTVSLRNYQ